MPGKGFFGGQWGAMDGFSRESECSGSGLCLRQLTLAAVWRMGRRCSVKTLTKLWGSPWRAVMVEWTRVEAVVEEADGLERFGKENDR